MLPDVEKAWLEPHRAMYLIGTEAPDNPSILASCNSPHTGYGDTGFQNAGAFLDELSKEFTEIMENSADAPALDGLYY